MWGDLEIEFTSDPCRLYYNMEHHLYTFLINIAIYDIKGVGYFTNSCLHESTMH